MAAVAAQVRLEVLLAHLAVMVAQAPPQASLALASLTQAVEVAAVIAETLPLLAAQVALAVAQMAAAAEMQGHLEQPIPEAVEAVVVVIRQMEAAAPAVPASSSSSTPYPFSLS